MRSTPWVALLLLVAPAGAERLTAPVTSEQQLQSRHELESRNGPGARGCLGERQFYQAFSDVGGEGMAWNPRNPASWYVGRNTYGLVESLINNGYANLSQAWTETVDGTDFEALAKNCQGSGTPRLLANCLNETVRAHFAAHPTRHPITGGDCKMYAAAVVAVASYLSPVTKQASIISGPKHAINELSIRDSDGREHLYMIDALNSLVVERAEERDAAEPQCPPEGVLTGVTVRSPAARTADRAPDWNRVGENLRGAESSAPVPGL